MTTKRNRRGDGHRRREELIVAAEEFLAAGMSEDAISVGALVETVGVTQPVLYQQFADKAALFTEVYRRRFADFGAQIQAAADLGATPEERLVRRGIAYVELAIADPVAYRRLFLDPDGIASTVYRPRTDSRPDEPTAFDDLVDNVEQILTKPRSDGDGPDIERVEAVDLARIIWSTVHGIASLAITIEHWDDGRLDELVSAATGAFLDGIWRTPPPRRRERARPLE